MGSSSECRHSGGGVVRFLRVLAPVQCRLGRVRTDLVFHGHFPLLVAVGDKPPRRTRFLRATIANETIPADDASRAILVRGGVCIVAWRRCRCSERSGHQWRRHWSRRDIFLLGSFNRFGPCGGRSATRQGPQLMALLSILAIIFGYGQLNYWVIPKWPTWSTFLCMLGRELIKCAGHQPAESPLCSDVRKSPRADGTSRMRQ